MKNDMLRIWNSVEVYNMYKDHGGKLYSRRTLLSKLLDILGSELLVLSGEGVTSLILSRSRASTAINFVASDEDDAIDVSIERISKKVAQESKQLSSDPSSYQTN